MDGDNNDCHILKYLPSYDLLGSNKECSGHGTCVCGKCRCQKEGDITYTGRYCEDCPVSIVCSAASFTDYCNFQ